MKAKAHRILGTLGTALAGAALLAGGAQAAERPDDRGGMIGVGGTQVVVVPPEVSDAISRNDRRFWAADEAQPVAPPDVFERAVARETAADHPAPPDVFERAVARVLADDLAVRPDDRAEARGPGATTSMALASSQVAADASFAWDDALLGAAAMLGVLLLGGAAMLTVRHRSRVILR